MKPLWTQTLAWILAIVVAVLFALVGTETQQLFNDGVLSHGSETPR